MDDDDAEAEGDDGAICESNDDDYRCTCPGQSASDYCDCGGDCTLNSEWCACAEAQAAACCGGDDDENEDEDEGED